MSRSEFKRLFTSQGSAPLEAIKAVGTSGTIRIDFERGLRSNALSMLGDITQSRIQLPKDDKIRVALSTYPWLMLVAFIGSSDFMFDVDVSCNVQLTPVSGNGAGIGVPVLKKISVKISIATYHDTQNKGSVCKVHLSAPKGQWSLLAFDLASYVATHCAHVAASETPDQQARSAPILGKGSRPNPPNLFAKAPRYEASVLTLSVERITLCGTVKVKEIVAASDPLIGETISRDLRLPLFSFPDQEGMLAPVQLTKDVLVTPPQEKPSPSGLRSIPLVTTHTYTSPSKEPQQLPQSTTGQLQEVSQPRPSSGFQVRFVRTAEGKVTFAAKDVAKELRQQEEQSQKEMQQELEQAREQLRVVLQEEEAGNAYRRLIEPEIPHQTDRFGVRVQEKSAPPPPAKTDPTLTIGAWEQGGLDGTDILKSAQNVPKISRDPLKKDNARQRISYLPARKPLFSSKLGEHVDAPPLPPTPSSLLLTSIMKRPLSNAHPADDIRMVRTPPAGGPAPLHGVCEGRMMGYGVGCLDVIRCADSEEESSGDDDTDTEDESDSDDEDDEG